MIISNNTAGGNGNKLSKPQRAPEAQQQHREDRHGNNTFSNNVNTGPWLCDHYKRRCLVKFDCCERYWPCHRCHNNKSNCGRKKLKSRDNRMIKCVSCQREQPFNETSQFCTGCGIKFAEYFCGRCKHLTGTDDKPYHCEKCGIC
ncbi:RING finger and CHY zinc finger domain-containing 1-like, partial [Paramuricea clavata]